MAKLESRAININLYRVIVHIWELGFKYRILMYIYMYILKYKHIIIILYMHTNIWQKRNSEHLSGSGGRDRGMKKTGETDLKG